MGMMQTIGRERDSAGSVRRSNRFTPELRESLCAEAREMLDSGVPRANVVRRLVDQHDISISAAYRATSPDGFSKKPIIPRRAIIHRHAEPGHAEMQVPSLTKDQQRLVSEFRIMAPDLVIETLRLCYGSVGSARATLERLRHGGGAMSMQVKDWATAALRGSGEHSPKR